jgi:signal transduction histidine kinase
MLIFSDTDSLTELKNRNQFSFSELVEKCLEEFSGKFWEKSLILNKNIAAAEIFGDSEKLRQAVICLLDNAVKFTPSGGTISVDLEKTGNQIFLKIKDTGEGISTEILPFIFERFQQSDSSTVRKHTGLGLGLAIAKKIVESHQGTIFAKSEGLQQGSLFVIALPSF